ncbi:MAG TPA: DUF2461 domain-containing protein [Williamwhitmania sp.]|nr:DUF2461 domain-containing protein [Williamwhitmania sp.]
MEQVDIINFLSDLQKNNNREWFAEHKASYQKTLTGFENIMSRIISLVGMFDKEVVGLNPKACIFRIYRDVRFSNDKSPYKTHFGGFIAPGGRKSSGGGYYIHLGPGESMVAGGAWRPESEHLKKIRRAIDFYHEEFLQIVGDKDFSRWFDDLSNEDSLVRVPAGFSVDSPVAAYLKLKSFTVGRTFTNKEVFLPTFENQLVEGCRAMFGLNKFLREAIE